MVMAYFHTFSSNKGVYLWCIDFKYFISFLGKQGFYFSRFRIVASIQNSAIFFSIFSADTKNYLWTEQHTWVDFIFFGRRHLSQEVLLWNKYEERRKYYYCPSHHPLLHIFVFVFVVEQIWRAAEMLLLLSITSSSPPYIACSALKKKRGHRHRSQFRSLWRPGC